MTPLDKAPFLSIRNVPFWAALVLAVILGVALFMT